MQLALLVHAIAGIGLFALVLGHIYMAVSVKGTLDAITSGEVDANWAKSHHQIWYEEMLAAGQVKPAAEARPGPDNATRTAGGAPHRA
jgi:formate dehydrogenase subunit gamma